MDKLSIGFAYNKPDLDGDVYASGSVNGRDAIIGMDFCDHNVINIVSIMFINIPDDFDDDVEKTEDAEFEIIEQKQLPYDIQAKDEEGESH